MKIRDNPEGHTNQDSQDSHFFGEGGGAISIFHNFSWHYSTSQSTLYVVGTEYKFGVWMFNWKINSILTALTVVECHDRTISLLCLRPPRSLSFFPNYT